jgi:hypothetical protein
VRKLLDVTDSTSKPDDGLIAFLKRAIVPGSDQILPSEEAESPDAVELSDVVAQIASPDLPLNVADSDTIGLKQFRKTLSPPELQELILTALMALPEVPKRGMSVTVYGFYPWNAMVTFAPGSTTAAKAKTIRQLLPGVVDQLRKEIQIEIPKDHILK